MVADLFDCLKQQLRPFRKLQGLWFPNFEYFRPRFSYENPSALFNRRRKRKANYPSPNRYLPKLVVGCPWVNHRTQKFQFVCLQNMNLCFNHSIPSIYLLKHTVCLNGRFETCQQPDFQELKTWTEVHTFSLVDQRFNPYAHLLLQNRSSCWTLCAAISTQ